MHLFWHSVARDPFCVHDAGTCRGALVSDGNGLFPAGETVYHSQDGLGRRPKRTGALAAYNVDVKRAEGLIGLKVNKRRAQKRVGVAIAIAYFACFHDCGDGTTDERPPEALCDTAQRSFIAVVRGLVKCAEHLFAKGGKYDNIIGDGALIALPKERVFDEELWPHVR